MDKISELNNLSEVDMPLNKLNQIYHVKQMQNQVELFIIF